MFRKPKKSAKKATMRRSTAALKDDDDNGELAGGTGGIRRNSSDDDDDDGDGDRETSLELQEARKRAKLSHNTKKEVLSTTTTSSSGPTGASSLHHYETKADELKSQKDLATSTNEYHPTELSKSKSEKTEQPRNKFLAGPIRAAGNVRTTSQFDYQPDICKDYKDTGFCGFGDTCIYLHDRGDTLSGWQLEQKWEKEQSLKKKKQEQQLEAFLKGAASGQRLEIDGSQDDDGGGGDGTAVADDGIPFACFLCRGPFTEPIITPCGHYFCQSCLQKHFKDDSTNGNDVHDFGQCCPICQKDTHGVMNQPTKLLMKKRKLLGRNATWQEYLDKLSSS